MSRHECLQESSSTNGVCFVKEFDRRGWGPLGSSGSHGCRPGKHARLFSPILGPSRLPGERSGGKGTAWRSVGGGLRHIGNWENGPKISKCLGVAWWSLSFFLGLFNTTSSNEELGGSHAYRSIGAVLRQRQCNLRGSTDKGSTASSATETARTYRDPYSPSLRYTGLVGFKNRAPSEPPGN